VVKLVIEPRLAIAMLERAATLGVAFAWVT
jgi:hypothetical protein